MKYRNQFLKYMAPASDGTEGGGAGGSEGGEQGGKGDEDNTDYKAENANLLKEVMKKKGRIKELEDAASKFEGIDLDRYAKLVEAEESAEAERKKAEQERLASEGKYEELLANKQKEHDGIVAQMVEKHKAELEAKDTKYQELESVGKQQLSQIEELTVGAAFGNSKVIRDDLVGVMTPARVRSLFGAHFEPNETGDVIGYDKPKGVEGRAPIVNAEGKPLSFDDSLKQILEGQADADTMFKSKVNGSGSGTKDGKGQEGTEVGSGIDRISHALNKTKS